MIPDEQVARIRHLFHAEHWKIGTIAAELLLHPDTVRRALETDRFRSQPRLRATRLFQMIVPRPRYAASNLWPTSSRVGPRKLTAP